jgi:multiple sugar transport system substrate-binding protein
MSHAHRPVTRRSLIGQGGVLLFALPLLAACGGATGAANASTGSAQVTASAAPATSTATSVASATSSVSATTAAVKASAVNGTIAFWHWGDQSYLTRYRALAAAFHQFNPAVTVDVTLQTKDFTSTILAAIAGGSPPESFTMDGQVAQSFGNKSAATTLDSRVAASKLLKMDQYDKISMAVLSYKGKVIGLPGVSIPGGEAPNLFFYNADHFQQAGITSPYDQWKAGNWTWNDMVEAAKKLLKKDSSGKMTLVPLSDGTLTRLWLNSTGGKETDDVIAPTKAFYDTPEAIKALQFVQDQRVKYGIVPAAGVSKELGANTDDAFIQGRLSMNTRWTTGINLYRQIKDFKWGLAPYPKDVTYANDASIAGLALPKGAAQVDAAWSWIEWASSPLGQQVDAKTTTGVPYDPAAKEIFLEEVKKIPNLTTPDVPGALVPNGKDTFFRMYCINEADLNTIISKEVGQLIANKTSAATAGQSITQQMDAFMKANPQT